MKRKYMDKSSGKCQRKLKSIEPEKVKKYRTWQWLSRKDLKIGTEVLLCAAEEQAIRPNYAKHHIDKTSESYLCRLCAKRVKVCNT